MKIFLSSTYKDLVTYREAAALAIKRLGHQDIGMEVFGARPLEATSACFKEILDSKALVGIYAHRYGYVPPGQKKSIVEQEFDFAVQKKKPTFCFVVEENYPWPPSHMDKELELKCLQRFIKRLRKQVIIDSFTTPDDLAFKVSTALGRFFQNEDFKEESLRERIISLLGSNDYKPMSAYGIAERLGVSYRNAKDKIDTLVMEEIIIFDYAGKFRVYAKKNREQNDRRTRR